MRAELPAAQDQFLTVLSRIPRDATFGGHTRPADRMPAAVGSTFAAAQGMIDRVHGLGSRMRAMAHMSGSAGFADADVDIVDVADLADGGPAGGAHAAHLARGQNNYRP